MRGALNLTVATLWVLITASRVAYSQSTSSTPFPCFKHHGRLSGGHNGITTRLWLIGTKRVVAPEGGVYIPEDGHAYFDPTGPDYSVIYGDFTICPIEPDVPGAMRLVRVTAAEKLVVENILDSSRPPFKLLSTWPKPVKDAMPKAK